MEENDNNNGFSIEQIVKKIQSLENRLSKLESKISLSASSVLEPTLETAHLEPRDEKPGVQEEKQDALWESNVGKYGLGWLANIVFIFGIAFVMAYIQSTGQHVISSIIGIAGVVGMFVFGYLLKKQFPYIAFIVTISAFLLLFYVIGALHFLSASPILPSKILALILLLLVAIGQMFFAIRRQSESLAGVGIIMLLATAVFSDTTHIMLPIVALAGGIAVYFFIKYEWWRILIISICLVYFAHLLWLFNNPIMGNEMGTVETHQYNLIYLFLYATIFFLPITFRHWEKATDSVFISSMLLNGLGFFLTSLFVVLAFYPEGYAWIFGVATVLFLLYSVILKLKSELAYSPAFYACYGFIALSVAVYGYYNFPGSYLLFALQSLLVISLAIWYRSTIIVVVNTILFFFLLLFYLTRVDSVDNINIAFALVGLASARILNWRKERVALKTEHFRNFYLGASFVMVLYTLYHIVPSHYITLSWTVAAGVYFLFSFILKNVKYRWLAIGTLIVAAIYLFFVDLARMDLLYRVIAFLFLAIISLGASLYYAKRLKK